MDPANTIISDKILLNDIDLQVISPSSTIYYGNNRIGDEVNNVEQVLISSPTIGNYTVILKSKLFTEILSQPVSLIITSGGYINKKVISITSSTYSINELSCTTQQQMITVTLQDHGGNGWGNGNSFIIQNEEQTITYYTYLMNGEVGKDSSYEISLCLTDGLKYFIKLIQNGSNKKDMAVIISQCSIYLSSYHIEDIIDLTIPLTCNTCSNTNQFQLTTLLFGPSNGNIPYGWKDDSKYSLFQQIENTNTTLTIAIGTLTTGIMSTRLFCLNIPGVYYLEFDNIPMNDDVYVSNSAGISSYRIEISNCGTNINPYDDMFDDQLYPYPRIQPGQGFKITISSSSKCTLQYVDDSLEPIIDDDSSSGVSFIKIHQEKLFLGMIMSLISFLLLLR